MSKPIIVCGMGPVGWRVLEFLHAVGLPMVVIDADAATASDGRLGSATFVHGDCRQREVLERAGIAGARGVILAGNDDLGNISTGLMVRHLNPDARIVIRMFNQNLVARLGKAVANVTALSVSALTAPVFALTALTGDALGTFALGNGIRQVAEVTVQPGSPLQGRRIADLGMEGPLLVLAHLPARGQRRLLQAVDGDRPLAEGDRLIVCGEPAELQRALDLDDSDLPSIYWAGWARRVGRIMHWMFTDVDLPVKVCTTVMLGVVLLSTLIFTIGINKTLPDGLYRTISVMATGGDMQESELVLPWQKVFVSFLRIAGAALTGAFTAIVTNYLLRARLGKALEIRRIPDGGHVVMCGLGSIGYRVTEELLNRGERVVVIEQSPDNRFLTTTRRRGVAVIVGDATIPELLRQAHAGTARAVIAGTDNELANLEIALLTRELNSTQRVVVRLSDPYLAETLRQEANIRLALSTSTLAAPAFVAALFGDRVPAMLLVSGKVLAVVELAVHPEDHFQGQSVCVLSIDYQFLPVALRRADQTMIDRPLHCSLEAGDHLTVIAGLTDLVRILRRECLPRDWALDVVAFPPASRDGLMSLLQTHRGLAEDAAAQALATLPVRLADFLTRGQAEDLRAKLAKEKVECWVHGPDGSLAPPPA